MILKGLPQPFALLFALAPLTIAATSRAQAPVAVFPVQPAISAVLPDETLSSSTSADGTSALPDDPAFQVGGPNDPHAANAGQKGHSEAGEPQQTKRILGIVPNFSSVTADQKLPPLSPVSKFKLAARNSFDYGSFALAAVQSAFSYNGNSYPEFHDGFVGYGRYYWHTLADTADENFMVGGLVPIVTREDPRFYTLGHGSIGHRAFYGWSRILQTRTDDGNETINFSEIVGAGAAAGVSSLYYPTHYRTWTKVGQKWATSMLIDSANFTFKEFWPDINHKLFHSH